MNCRYVQSRLSAYLDFELSGTEQQQIRSHLEQCIECSLELESLKRTKQILRQLPVVAPSREPEHILQRVRCSAPAPRRAPLVRWSIPRWWQFAGGFALAAAFFVWGRPADSVTAATPPPDALSSAAFTTASPILSPAYPQNHLFSIYRPSALFSVRRSHYYSNEPSLIPSFAHPSDSLLGYQPVSELNPILAEPKMMESQR
ncbi:MAG: hypothetical protein KatS3mg020_0079 [Fimbriimonadales bacterium]|nr:MAG: hypothetical protein KatS3mg020_0079 [Fimbriimonadales bacterium]